MRAEYIALVVLLVAIQLQTTVGIKCKLCWPAMDKTKCRASEKTINCNHLKRFKYDRCIEVQYHGNHSVTRTCYSSWKCEGARLHCTKYGPCEVKCCKGNYCNPAGIKTAPSLAFTAIAAVIIFYLTNY